ncbi:SGNH hydrolase-type esterase domain-containing protein [Pilaira anomala]|nr:SGNH hydrolase-type esterase domain-containing protein [Pilaira anomala]
MSISSNSIQSYQVLQRDFSSQGVNVQLNNGKTKFYSVGGPYTIDKKKNVMVGDVWVLAGQSNMRGTSFFKDPWSNQTVEKLIYDTTFHLFGMKEQWAIAKDPVHQLSQSIRNITKQIPDGTVSDPNLSLVRGGSMALSFAKKYQELMRPQVPTLPIGLIASAHAGVSLDQWSPTLLRDTDGWKNDTLYGAMLGRIESSTGGTKKIAGILWYQGESDTRKHQDFDSYKNRMSAWIKSVRDDVGNKELAVVQVQIAREINALDYNKGWTTLRQAQTELIDKRIATVSSIDCPLDDRIHLSLTGEYTIGRRVAIAAKAALKNEAFKASPQILESSIKYEEKVVSGSSKTYALKLSFSHLGGGGGGQFEHVDSPAGFSIRDENGVDQELIYRTAFYENNKVVRVLLTDSVVKNLSKKEFYLYYGYGKNPVCNLVSTNGMGLLAFGPIKITF